MISNQWTVFVLLGNCVELAYNGVLNNVKCENFTEGCPDSPYLSDEIYKCKYVHYTDELRIPGYLKNFHKQISIISLFLGNNGKELNI